MKKQKDGWERIIFGLKSKNNGVINLITLSEKYLQNFSLQSSKGNQLKWKKDDLWYKADYLGYESLVEYVVSHLLQYSTLKADEFIIYDISQVNYKENVLNCCSSKDFISDSGYQLITLERLYNEFCDRSLYKEIWRLNTVKERISIFIDKISAITNLKDFGKYLSILITIDALFLNEDRHFHNIAVLMDSVGKFEYCPIFDNGACLASDTSIDYSLTQDSILLINKIKAKTFSQDFDEQLDCVEELYGKNIFFYFNRKDLEKLLNKPELNVYAREEKTRVFEIISYQMRKYDYLFINKKDNLKTMNFF